VHEEEPGREAAVPRTAGAALALALAAAVSLGLARFSYALLLPPMRQDLAWSYVTAGGMNTFNAAGYLLGALLMPRLMRRFDARLLMLAGGAGSALLLALHAGTRSDAVLIVLRTATGVCSAFSFVGGGLLAARLASLASARAGLVLGVYYGGVGIGIIGSALLVPPLVDAQAARWPAAWLALAAAAALLTVLTAAGTRGLVAPPPPPGERTRLAMRTLAFGLAGYAMFGLGYIAYMTFIITLLREQGLSGAGVIAFYVLLGLGVLASSWLWAGLLQRHRNGRPMALLNGLLALATVLPVASAHPLADAGGQRASAGGLRLGRALRRRLPLGGGVDDGARAAQLGAGRLACGDRRLHHRLRRRADRRPDRRRLDRRRQRRPRARLRGQRGDAGAGRVACEPAARAAQALKRGAARECAR